MRFAQPTTPTVGTDPLDIELFAQLGRGDLAGLVLGLVARELTREPFPPPGLGLELRRELVTARVAVLLVFGLIGCDRLRDDLSRDPVKSTFASLLALAVTFVPSTATTPDPTSPAFAHNRSTDVNSSASACW